MLMLAAWTQGQHSRFFLQAPKPGAQDAAGAQKNVGVNTVPIQASAALPAQPLTASTARPSVSAPFQPNAAAASVSSLSLGLEGRPLHGLQQ